MAKKEYTVLPASESVNRFGPVDLKLIAEAWQNYEGSLEVFESAVGAWMLGRLAGSDALKVVHSWKTLRNYEKILRIEFSQLDRRTKESSRVSGIRMADKFKAFWRALSAGVSAEPGAREVSR